MIKLKIILGSTRDGRQGEKFAHWVMEQLKGNKIFSSELLDLKSFPLPYYEDELPAMMLKKPYMSKERALWANKIAEGEAFIIITPEYNHGYPAVLKSALDTIYHEWNNKPVAFISYGGGANGSRAVEQLRQVVIELQMAPIRESVHIGLFTGQEVFTQSGDMATPSNNGKLLKLLEQLSWWAEALTAARAKS
jgi:NAD(P)H-dependent FMN reductase